MNKNIDILDQFLNNLKKFGKMLLEIPEFSLAKTANFGKSNEAVKGFLS